MPKTKNAFALRDFDKDFIRGQFKGNSFGVSDDAFDDGIESRFQDFFCPYDDTPITDEEFIDVYCAEAVNAQKEYHYYRVKWVADILGIISKNLSGYMDKICRHGKRLKKFSDKWNETICKDETFSADEIRTKTRRIQLLLKSYSDVYNSIKNLQRSIKRHIVDITDAYEKADRNIFAIRLRQARTEAGLTQTQLANKIGMTQGGYTNYENSTREPSIATLKKLARVLKRPTDWLLGLTPSETRQKIKSDDFEFFQ